MIDLKINHSKRRTPGVCSRSSYCILILGFLLLCSAKSDAVPICKKNGQAQSSQDIKATEFGVIGDGKTDNSDALQDAIDCLQGHGSLVIPSGKYLVKSDIKINSGVAIRGNGYGTHFLLDGAAIVVNGAGVKGGVANWQLSDFQVSRIGDSGPAIKMSGTDIAGANRGAIRGYTQNIYVSGSTGDGVELSNAYLITNVNLNIRKSAGSAINMKLGPAGLVSANAITFVGGEIQQNGRAVTADSAVGITFVGVAIEGNKEGVDLINNNRSFAFYNCYFEWNGGFDIRAGVGKSGAVGLVVDNGYFADGQADKEYSIDIVKAAGVDIRSTIFSGYSIAALKIPVAGNAVKGIYGNLTMGAGTPSACIKCNGNFKEIGGRRGMQFNEKLQHSLNNIIAN